MRLTHLVSSLAALLLMMLCGPAVGRAQIVYHVDDDAPLGGDGLAWDTAYTYLQDALAVAVTGDEIRVAQGTYRPDQDGLNPSGTGDRTATFTLVNGIALLGGFAGLSDPEYPDVRDVAMHGTILSGDLAEDDSPDFTNNNENSFHVITAGASVESVTQVDGLTVTAGTADGLPDDLVGAGLDCLGAPTLTDCTFAGNYAYGGAGAAMHAGGAIITNCTFDGNSAIAGGGLAAYSASPMLSNCTFVSNTASNVGGGLYSTHGNPELTNCTFRENEASTNGGGLYNLAGLLTLTNSTLTENGAGAGGGGLGNGTGSSVLANCIVWGNDGGQISGEATVSYSDVQGGFEGEGNIDADPLLLTSDGPPRLGPGSPCIDAGNNGAVPPDVTTDAGGDDRFVDDPETPDTGAGTPPLVDMGAYEFTPDCNGNGVPDSEDIAQGTSADCNGNGWPDECDIAYGISPDANGDGVPDECPLYVDDDAPPDGDGTSWDTAFKHLQDALAVVLPGQEIRVAQGTYWPDQDNANPEGTADRTATFTLVDGVSLLGGFAGLSDPEAPDSRNIEAFPTILSGDIGISGTDSDNCYHVLTAPVSVGPGTLLEGVTVTAGRASGSYHSRGGGMHCKGSPTLQNCSFVTNYAYFRGGGMYIDDGSPILIQCLFWNNTAGDMGGALDVSGAPTLINCTISGNTAPSAGGVYESGYPTLANCIVWGNGGGSLDSYFSGTVTFCNIDGYSTGEGNIDVDPRFLYRNGRLRPGPGSPCIDAGSNALVPPGVVADVGGKARFVDDPLMPDTGLGASPLVDMGSHEFSPDCNGNGVADLEDITQGTSLDCNENGWPDECDIAHGVSIDEDGNGVPDECDTPVVYVDDDAPSDGDGMSWATAFNHLQDALAVVLPGQEIHVAHGTYWPDRDASNPAGTGFLFSTFSLVDGVALRGAYAGLSDPGAPDTRNTAIYQSWLSGDIGTPESIDDNCQHVVTIPALVGRDGVLDGFTVSDGYARGDWPASAGGALFCNGCARIENCTFSANTGFSGGALYNAGAPILSHCYFTQNTAQSGGGGVWNRWDLSLVNCAFHGNVASERGGALYNGLDCALTNCTIIGNSAPEVGGVTGAHMQLDNCVVWGNAGGQLGSTSYAVEYSDIQGGYGGEGNIDANPLLLYFEGRLRPRPGSPCIDAGNNAVIPPDITTDLSGGARFTDDPFTPDTGSGTAPVVDMGAIEFTPDCNGNGIPDVEDIAQGASADCNENGLPDECDLAYGSSLDQDGNGVPDECDTQILYVDDDATSGGTGMSWESALAHLQDALAVVLPGQEIRIAQGTYWPDRDSASPGGTGSRTATFTLVDGMELKGGYAGLTNPEAPNNRDITAYPTVLSGDIGTQGTAIDNSYHVVTAPAHVSTGTVMNGITVADGTADGTSFYRRGAGLYCDGSPTLTNCTFSENVAISQGAGVLCNFGAPILLNCVFAHNTAGTGSGLSNWWGSPVLTGCVFYGNTTSWEGAGLYCEDGSVTLTNCTFSANYAESHAGVSSHHWSRGTTIIHNCILWGNVASSGSVESWQIGGVDAGHVAYSCVQGWTGALGGIGNVGYTPYFVDDENLRLQSWSPLINAGDPTYQPDPGLTDLDGNPRILWERVDIGAYESPIVSPDDDEDGLPDDWEFAYWMDLSQGPLDDPDGDCTPNLGEWFYGLNPTLWEDVPLRLESWVSPSTINVANGEEVVLEVSLNRAAAVSVLFRKASDDSLVSVLTDAEAFAPGVTGLIWDGYGNPDDPADAQLMPLPEGAYYYELIIDDTCGTHLEFGRQTLTTPGYGDEPPYFVQGDFDPWLNDLVEIGFTFTDMGKVLVQIVPGFRYDGEERERERRRDSIRDITVYGGKHVPRVVFWDGRNDDGHIYTGSFNMVIPPPDGVPSNSVIVLNDSALITQVTCEAYLIVPTYNHISTIGYSLSDPADVEITLQDPQGGHFATLLPLTAQDGGDHSVLWDGRNDLGELIDLEGEYTVIMTATDPETGVTMTRLGVVMAYR